jgi:CRP/FNR family transcriptional regulator, nitrogen fixation regulation protein
MDLGLGTCGACHRLPTNCAWDTLALARLMTLVRCEVNEVIYHNQEQAQYWYRVVSGAARKCSLMMDGRRQIVDFLLPEDVFGFGARDLHHFSTEAVTPGTTIARYPRSAAEQLAESDPQVSRWVRQKAFQSISRLQARTLIVGHTSALARVSAFLLEWMDRCNQPTGTTIILPMSRYDIADYLAMAVETVSRVLTLLRKQNVIVFCSTRRFRICDRRALELAIVGTQDLLFEIDAAQGLRQRSI